MKSVLIFLCCCCIFISACTENTDHPTYTITRKGVMFDNEHFDVVHVYGFSNNEEVARQITEFLNQEEPNTYQFKQDD